MIALQVLQVNALFLLEQSTRGAAELIKQSRAQAEMVTEGDKSFLNVPVLPRLFPPLCPALPDCGLLWLFCCCWRHENIQTTFVHNIAAQ